MFLRQCLSWETVKALERYINKKLRFLGNLRFLYQRYEDPRLEDPGGISDEDIKKPMKLLAWQEKTKAILKSASIRG